MLYNLLLLLIIQLDIRMRQRSGRKSVTIIHGLPKEYDHKRVLKVFKKEFACNGSIDEDEEFGEVIQLQGDHRVKTRDLLLEEGICQKDDIQVHGF
jgi:translation initiation factor 1